MKYKWVKVAALIVGITSITMFSGCSSCSRSLKSLSSDIDGGLNRTVTVYDSRRMMKYERNRKKENKLGFHCDCGIIA